MGLQALLESCHAGHDAHFACYPHWTRMTVKL
jgi:hypothetical protein